MPNWKQLYAETWNELVSLKTQVASLKIENKTLSEKHKLLLQQHHRNKKTLKQLNNLKERYAQQQKEIIDTKNKLNALNDRRKLQRQIEILKKGKLDHAHNMEHMSKKIKKLKYQHNQEIYTIKSLRKELNHKNIAINNLRNDFTDLKNEKNVLKYELKQQHRRFIRNDCATNILDISTHSLPPPKKKRRIQEVNTVNISVSESGSRSTSKLPERYIERRYRWSNTECKALMRGYTRYGDEWSKIKNDKDLKTIFNGKRTTRDIQRKFKYLTEKKGWNPKDFWRCVL